MKVLVFFGLLREDSEDAKSRHHNRRTEDDAEGDFRRADGDLPGGGNTLIGRANGDAVHRVGMDDGEDIHLTSPMWSGRLQQCKCDTCSLIVFIPNDN